MMLTTIIMMAKAILAKDRHHMQAPRPRVVCVRTTDHAEICFVVLNAAQEGGGTTILETSALLRLWKATASAIYVSLQPLCFLVGKELWSPRFLGRDLQSAAITMAEGVEFRNIEISLSCADPHNACMRYAATSGVKVNCLLLLNLLARCVSLFAGSTDQSRRGGVGLFPRGVAEVARAHAVRSNFVDDLRDSQSLAIERHRRGRAVSLK